MSLSGESTPTLRWPAWLWRAIVWGIIALVVIVFFRGWLHAGLPASARREVLPHYTFIWQIAENLRNGHLYVDWDPCFFAGYPWLRFLQYPTYAIPAILSLIPGLSLAWALKLFTIGTYVVSGWVMAELARRILLHGGRDDAISWSGGMVAGMAYALLPFHIHLGLEIIHHAAFWAVLPLPFLVYERARPAGLSPRDGIWLGVSLAAYALVDTEHTLIALPFLALYVLLREALYLRRRWRRTVASVAVAAVVSLGLAAFYVVPGIADLGNVGITARFGPGGTADEGFARNTGLSVGALVTAALNRAGFLYHPDDRPMVFGWFGSHSWYLGVVAVILAVTAAFRWRRSSAVPICAALLLVAFGWSARAWLPVNIFRAIPFFGSLSGLRGMMLMGFFLTLLAGFGAAWLVASAHRLSTQLLLLLVIVVALFMDRPRLTTTYLAETIGLLGLLAVAMLAARSRRHAYIPLVVGLLLVGAIATDYRLGGNAVTNLPRYFEVDEVQAYRWLSAQGSGFRIWEYTDRYDDAEFLHTFSLAYNQIPRFGGYFDNGATAAQWRLYKWGKPEHGLDDLDEEQLRTALKLSSVRYLLLHRRVWSYDQVMQIAPRLGFGKLAWQSANVTIFEDPDWRPIARVYDETAYVSGSPTDELAALPRLDRANWALVAADHASLTDREIAPTEIPALCCGNLPAASAPSPASITRTSAQRIELETNSAHPGLLVVAESWYGSWRATVDGKPVPVLRANGPFMAVRLDAGKHHVVYWYALPLSVALGRLMSAVTVLGLLVWRAAGVRGTRPLP